MTTVPSLDNTLIFLTIQILPFAGSSANLLWQINLLTFKDDKIVVQQQFTVNLQSPWIHIKSAANYNNIHCAIHGEFVSATYVIQITREYIVYKKWGILGVQTQFANNLKNWKNKQNKKLLANQQRTQQNRNSRVIHSSNVW